MGMEHNLYVQIVIFLIGWCESAPEGQIPDRFDKIEAFREALRSILTVTGVHRMTEVLAEGWQIFTAVKIGSVEGFAVPIAGAAPAPHRGDLQAVGRVRHASILQQELDSFKEWLTEIHEFAVSEGQNGLLIEWLLDLQFVIAATLFCVVHRDV